MNMLAGEELWVARYNYYYDTAIPRGIWQSSSTSRVNGVSGNDFYQTNTIFHESVPIYLPDILHHNIDTIFLCYRLSIVRSSWHN